MKISKDGICIVGILTTVVIVCITCSTLIRGGYARDAGIIVPAVVDNLVWVTIPICCIALFLFLFLLKSADSKKKRNLAAVIFIMVALLGGISNIMWTVSFHKEENAGVQHANIREITLDELENVIVGNDKEIVYVGRDSCPLCEYILPDLITYIEAKNLKILYYNTEQDRNSNKENMDKVLDSIPIDGVPFIMVVDQKEIVAQFSGKHLVEEFSAYMG